MTEPPNGSARLLLVAAGLLIVATSCSSAGRDAAASTIAPIGSTTAPTSTASPTPAPTSVVVTTAAPTAAPAVATAPPTAAPTTLPDGATVLQQSFDVLAGGYHFVTTATVNGSPVLVAEGDHIAGNTRMTLTSQGKTVDYIVLPDQTWVAEGGNWQELDEPAPAGDPISVLRTPESVAVSSYTPELTTVTAAYPPSALAVAGDQPVTVLFELAGTSLRTIAYEVPGAASNVHAEISALVDTTPITSPAIGD